MPLTVDVEHLSFVEIRDRQGRDLVTVIELLSPTNKRPGPDREQYLAKRRQLLASGVHLVEIDLLRGHPRLPLDDLPPCDYYVMVSRAEERPQAGLWPLGLRDPLPPIPVPLRAADPDASLDLQAGPESDLRRRRVSVLHLRRRPAPAPEAGGRGLGGEVFARDDLNRRYTPIAAYACCGYPDYQQFHALPLL